MEDKYLEEIIEKARLWLGDDFDVDIRNEVQYLIENDNEKLVDAFYKDLEFGTGGLRGIMGAGTNRMNKYTLGMANQGLSNYLKKQFGKHKQIKIAIGYDCRHNSKMFAEISADIFAANGFEVFIFDSLRPTPELSFTIRHLKCQSGVIITASHNPPEYNGYKAYWDDGGQITSPHDHNIINEVRKITTVRDIKFGGSKENIHIIGKEIDDLFIEAGAKYILNPDIIRRNNDTAIVYSPIHGTGVKLIPDSLRRFGFTNIIPVPEQDKIDGNFPTVKSPNPEEAEALSMAINKAIETGAEIVMASDPDADRLGVAVRNMEDRFILLNGNQTAVLLTWYILSQYKNQGRLNGNEYIIKTIVTSDLIDNIAESIGVECFNVLTGFKYFASLIKELEGKKQYIGGGEESFGYLPGDYVRDKDAVTSCALFAETTAFAKDMGKTVFELLIDIYIEFGLYKERLVNIIRKGIHGAEEISSIMSGFREKHPVEINKSRVIKICDYKSLISKDLINGHEESIKLEASNVLQYFLEDGSKISVRPSGTEPKIKFYFSVNKALKNKDLFKDAESELETRIDAIINDLNILI